MVFKENKKIQFPNTGREWLDFRNEEILYKNGVSEKPRYRKEIY